MSRVDITKVTVLVADDHPPTRAMVRTTLEDAGFHVCAETDNSADAVALAKAHQPDICLLDIRMPGNGIAAARQISSQVHGTVVVMLTESLDDDDLFGAVSAGANGYLLKGADHSRLPGTLQRVLEGEAALSRSLVARLIDEFRRREQHRHVRTAQGDVSLSDREWQVLELLRLGRTTAQIARELFVAPVTVRSHVASILRKLQVGTREEMLKMLDPGGSQAGPHRDDLR